MLYKNIQQAVFLERPNRFIAICSIDGERVVCHVKNTGRCRELLVPGCTVYVEPSQNRQRKTPYDLVSVMKGGRLFNIDAQAPNKVFHEWLCGGGLFKDITLIRPETVYHNSRLDFYVEHGERRAFIEVKGVTLEEEGVLLFPDAPTERGVKHIHELCKAKAEGYDAYIAFVIQTEHADIFMPNRKTHPAFAEALALAEQKGVRILCVNCHTTPDSLSIWKSVPFDLK